MTETSTQPETTLLNSAQLYLCTDARTDSGDFSDFLNAAYTGGVDIIQLRDKNLEAQDELEALATLEKVAQEHGKLWAVNDRADVAAVSASPVLHLGQRDLSVEQSTTLAPRAKVGLSTHTTEQVDAALAATGAAKPDYFCVGPLWRTPTKPGRAAVGLGLVEYAASRAPADLPWFAIGGINLGNIAQVVQAGARRVVVVRAITSADDPAQAARDLKAQLPQL